MQKPPRHANGFTLIELMITVAIVGILGAIAYPSFVEYIRKSRRAEGIAALSQIQQAQERWRGQSPTYAANAVLSTAWPGGLGITTPTASGDYALAISGETATGYTATATATGRQAADGTCTALSVQLNNGTATYSATPTANANRCWNK